MTVYLFYGQPGTGKTTAATARAIDYARQGRQVYANYPIDFAQVYNRKGSRFSNAFCHVIPDRPSRDDLEILQGGETEEKSALLIIDEAGMWLNTRGWASDKSRMDVIDWLTQSRKRGFDVILIAQAPNMLDKQVREGCIELFGRCQNMSRVKIFGLFRLPRFHICRIRFDVNPSSPITERLIYTGSEAHKTYDTRKAFGLDASHYCVLPSRLSKWRYEQNAGEKLAAVWQRYLEAGQPVRPVPSNKHPLVDRIMKLPEDQRLEFFRRFEQTGAFERYSGI